MIALRASTHRDGERVVALWAAAVDATHGFLSPADRAAIEVEVRAFLPTAPLTLAIVDARIAGFMLAAAGRIEALFVDPTFHRRGIGGALVDRAAAVGGVLALDVNAQNPGAIAFYRRLGFVATGRSPVDGAGRPYPLIHMTRRQPVGQPPV